MKITKLLLSLLLMTFLACSGGSKNQNQTSNEEIKKVDSPEVLAVKNYLKTTKKLETIPLSYGDFNKVFETDVFEATIQQEFPKPDGVARIPISSAIFLRMNNKIFPFPYLDSLMASKEIIASIKEGLTLKTNEDAITIYEALNVLDPDGARENLGYINENETWFFIRNENDFSEEHSGYMFSTSSNGSIASILPHTVKNMDTGKVVVPDINFRRETGHKLSLSDSEIEFVRNYIETNSTASFGVDTLATPKLNELNANLYTYSIVYTVEQNGFSGSHSHSGMFVIEFNGTMQHIDSNKEVPCSKLFKQIANAQITLSTNDDAQQFECLLDEINPAKSEEIKSFYKEGKAWHFVRDTFFDDKSGYVVEIDTNGKIAAISYKLKLKK